MERKSKNNTLKEIVETLEIPKTKVKNSLEENNINDSSSKDKKEEISKEKLSKKSKKDKDKEVKKKPKKKKPKLTQADIKKYSQSELDHVILKIKANEIKYTIITVLIILSLLFTGLYFVFTAVQKNIQYNTLMSGDLAIDFRETDNGLGNIVDLVDVKTYSNSKNVPNSYTFTITNKSDEVRDYQVFIEDDTDMIKIDNCNDIFLDTSFLRYNINGGPSMVLNKENNNRVIYGTLKANEKITYTLKVWVSDTYSGKIHYHGKFVVKDSTKEKDNDKLETRVKEN